MTGAVGISAGKGAIVKCPGPRFCRRPRSAPAVLANETCVGVPRRDWTPLSHFVIPFSAERLVWTGPNTRQANAEPYPCLLANAVPLLRPSPEEGSGFSTSVAGCLETKSPLLPFWLLLVLLVLLVLFLPVLAAVSF